MMLYCILYSLFALSHGAAICCYQTFRGSSQGAHNYIGCVSAIGSLAYLIFSICHFFIISFWLSIALIVGTFLFAPTIGMRICRNPFVIVLSPILTIVFGVAFFVYALHLYGVI